MKTKFLVFTALLSSYTFFAQAQLYSPEIKVQQTTGNQVEVGTDQATTHLKVYGNTYTDILVSSGLQIGQYGNSLAGDPNPYSINSPLNQGDQDLTIYGANSGSTLHLRLYDGNLKFGQAEQPNSTLYNNGDAFLKKLTVGNFGDNSILTFKAANDKTAHISLQDDGTDGLFFNTGGSNRMYINENGRVGIGWAVAGYKLHVNGTVAASNFYNTSDRKLKKDIKTYDQGLSLVKQFKPVKFKYKPRKINKTEDGETTSAEKFEEDNRDYIGVIAQEVQAFAPDLVDSFMGDEGEEILTINHTALTFILINAVQEQQATIEELQNEIKTLTDKQKK